VFIVFVLKALRNIGVPDDRAKDLILSVKDKKISERLKQVTAEAISYGVIRF